jgi:hypothetical protein
MLPQEEYRSLRQTVQHRGTLRFVAALVSWIVWAALALHSWTSGVAPLVGVFSLMVLVGGFEIVLALHVGVERIGRYIQVMFETGSNAAPAWEHTAMAMGARWSSPGGLDPLFGGIFLLATLLNSLQGLVGGASAPEIVGSIVIHLGFALRILGARRYASRQRALDLAAVKEALASNSLVSRIQQDQ